MMTTDELAHQLERIHVLADLLLDLLIGNPRAQVLTEIIIEASVRVLSPYQEQEPVVTTSIPVEFQFLMTISPMVTGSFRCMVNKFSKRGSIIAIGTGAVVLTGIQRRGVPSEKTTAVTTLLGSVNSCRA